MNSAPKKKLSEKKQEIASKMRGPKFAKSNDTVEGDYGQKYKEDSFTRKDVNKEKKGRAERHGSMPKSNWEI